MKNNKGFTLIELLVSITIMCIVLFMVIPSVVDLQSNNQSRPFEYYGKSLVEAAKIYVRKEDEDLTSLGTSQWIGCVDISYDDLLASDLIKVYNDERYNCRNGKVRYTKERNRETFTYNLTCVDQKTGKQVFHHQEVGNSTCHQSAS